MVKTCRIGVTFYMTYSRRNSSFWVSSKPRGEPTGDFYHKELLLLFVHCTMYLASLPLTRTFNNNCHFCFSSSNAQLRGHTQEPASVSFHRFLISSVSGPWCSWSAQIAFIFSTVPCHMVCDSLSWCQNIHFYCSPVHTAVTQPATCSIRWQPIREQHWR